MLTFNYVLIGFVTLYLFQLWFSLRLEKLNRGYLKGKKVPPAFAGVIDERKLAKINAYTLDKSRLGQIQEIISSILVLGVILSGFLPVLNLYPDQSHYILSGTLFFLVLGFLFLLIELPFGYYHTFILEEKYGFNRSTLQIWITDLLKNGIMSIIFLVLMLSPVLWFIHKFPKSWWLWGFFAVSGVQLTLTVLYPILIAPLFNKFEPLKDRELAEKVHALMDDAGIKIKEILQMDAGKRSRHTNAYFTGLGKTKRIVFYDTLLSSHTHEEILAVLAHEAGHFKGKHIIKQLILFEGMMLAGFYLTFLMMNWKLVPLTFGYPPSQSHIGLLFLSIFWEKTGYFFKPLYTSLSRKFEKEADLFSYKMLKTNQPMIKGLKRLASDNLANLNPHPFYAWFNYSHPPLAERIARLEKLQRHPCNNIE